MRAGQLRHRVVIKKPAHARDAAGGYTETFQTVATLWARVEPVSAREQMTHEQLQQGITHRVTLRGFKGTVNGAYFGNYFGSRYFAPRYFSKYGSGAVELKPDWNVMFGTRRLRIVGIRNLDERTITHELMCEEMPA